VEPIYAGGFAVLAFILGLILGSLVKVRKAITPSTLLKEKLGQIVYGPPEGVQAKLQKLAEAWEVIFGDNPLSPPRN
jgi:hypothetical protein